MTLLFALLHDLFLCWPLFLGVIAIIALALVHPDENGENVRPWWKELD